MTSKKGRKHGARHRPGQVRIIGGKWRGRNIAVAASGDLRPTPNRIRETVFNWLSPRIEGAVCLDLFAGSGALGFEALSRGAANVVMLDTDPMAIAMLQHTQARLGADAVKIIRQDALDWLEQNTVKYDIVFLDPPFQSDLMQQSCRLLSITGCLHSRACVYAETELGSRLHTARLRAVKTAQAGQVHYGLYVHDRHNGHHDGHRGSD